MLQNPCKTLGFKKNMVYNIPHGGGGGKPYPASGLLGESTSIDLHLIRVDKISKQTSSSFILT